MVSFKNYGSTVFRGPGMALISGNVGYRLSVLHSSPPMIYGCVSHLKCHMVLMLIYCLLYAVLCMCLSAGYLAVSGMIVRWVGVWIEGAW